MEVTIRRCVFVGCTCACGLIQDGSVRFQESYPGIARILRTEEHPAAPQCLDRTLLTPPRGRSPVLDRWSLTQHLRQIHENTIESRFGVMRKVLWEANQRYERGCYNACAAMSRIGTANGGTSNGLDAARVLKRLMPAVPLIMCSAFG